MSPVILFRSGDLDDELEAQIASKYFKVFNYRSHVPEDTLVIPRYSALPFYRELEEDLKTKRSTLLNSLKQHRWVADFDYYYEFEDVTPKTWWERDFPLSDHPGPFVIKGVTNSRKQRWKTHMFAETRRDATLIACELSQDPLIGEQDLIYRKYVPLKTLETCIVSGMPFTNEYRMFFYKDQLLTQGYYWSNAECAESQKITPKGLEFGKQLAKRAAKYCNFFVLDIAEKADIPDEWVLIEINDGQQSGLSMCDPDQLYSNLKKALS